MMKEAETDILRKIHEAERRAEKILREAEAQARALLEEARLKGRERMKTKKEELAARRQEMLQSGLDAAEIQTREFLDQSRAEAERLTQRLKPHVPQAAERLKRVVLPL